MKFIYIINIQDVQPLKQWFWMCLKMWEGDETTIFFLNFKQMLQSDLFSGAQPKQYYSMPCTAQWEPNIRHEYEFLKGYDEPLQYIPTFLADLLRTTSMCLLQPRSDDIITPRNFASNCCSILVFPTKILATWFCLRWWLLCFVLKHVLFRWVKWSLVIRVH